MNRKCIVDSIEMGLDRAYHNDLVDDFDFGSMTLFKFPFKVLQLNHFARNSDEFISNLREAILPICSVARNNDLLKLHQTIDLNNVKNESIVNFIQLLKDTMIPWLENLFNYKLNRNCISITGSHYQKGDYLLCHDDKLDDRAIAFVYYLNTVESPSGCFQMFDHDAWNRPVKVVRSIAPKKNRFLLFEVGDTTFHQVSEMLCNQGRLTINGWFHSITPHYVTQSPMEPMTSLARPVLMNSQLTLMNNNYKAPLFMAQAAIEFEQESCISLSKFLKCGVNTRIRSALGHDSIAWKSFGPPNVRKYDVACTTSMPDCVSSLIRFAKSSIFIDYLSKISQLDLYSAEKEDCRVFLELRRYTSGSYSMVTSNNDYFMYGGLDVYLFFRVGDLSDDSGGTISYIIADGSEGPHEESELLTIVPEDNTLFAIYRTTDTASFVKYINRSFTGTIYCLAVTYFLGAT